MRNEFWKSIPALAAVIVGGGVAGAADLAVKAPVYKAPVVVAPSNWTGFYIGGQGGFAWGQSEHYDPLGNSSGLYDIKGGFGGATVGYNWQIYNWVIGLEDDISASDIKAAVNSSRPTWTCILPNGCVTDIKWFGTARGRLGYAYDQLLLYGTGGAAFGRVHSSEPAPGLDSSSDRVGWTAGGGLEYGFTPHWSAKVEYLHVDLGRDFQWAPFVFNGAADPLLTRARFDLVRGGINYRF
jgi:outer membrane immunogenic protein